MWWVLLIPFAMAGVREGFKAPRIHHRRNYVWIPRHSPRAQARSKHDYGYISPSLDIDK